MSKKYSLYRFSAKIEGLNDIGNWELIQSIDGGLRVNSLSKIKKWIDLAKPIKDKVK